MLKFLLADCKHDPISKQPHCTIPYSSQCHLHSAGSISVMPKAEESNCKLLFNGSLLVLGIILKSLAILNCCQNIIKASWCDTTIVLKDLQPIVFPVMKQELELRTVLIDLPPLLPV